MALVAALALILPGGILGGMIHSGTPGGVPPSADCAIRKAAWEYGKKLQPARGDFKTLYDALQLQHCGVRAPLTLDQWTPLSDPLPQDQQVLFVDGAAPSSDASRNTYRTIAEAVAASKSLLKPLTIALRTGTHFVADGPVELGPEDSGLTIRNAPGEHAVVSGGKNLTVAWRQSKACAGCYETSLKGQVADVLGLRRNGVREIRARYPNYDPELDSVINGEYLVHDGRTGWISGSTNWIQSGAVNMNGVPGTWPPTEPAVTHVIGAKDWPGVEWPMNIMTNGTVDKDGWTGEGDWGEYWVGVGGTCIDRSPPAGYWCAPGAPRRISTPNHPSGIAPTKENLPNSPYAHPEGAVIHAWRPGHWYTNIFEVGTDGKPSGGEVVKSWEFYSNRNQVYGKCPSPTQCHDGVSHLGAFDTLQKCQAAVNSTHPSKCAWYTYHHADFGGEYASHCYCGKDFEWSPHQQDKVDSGRAPGTFNKDAGEWLFSRGGIQGGEGVTGGEAWYIENVLEELDIGREWYFDNRSQTLYYKPNSTDDAMPTGSFVATAEKVLFNIVGTQEKPAKHIAIKGVTLRDTAYAYFDPHGLPSGGDWALQQQGAITLIGTENIQIDSNLFTRLDGNAIFIGGYNRGMAISDNEFFGIGDSAMAAWGDTSFNLNANASLTLPYPIGPDGREGNQPRGTVVKNNIVHEIGLWQKQSSLWFQAVTAQTTLKGNVFFNGPRAALNFNDGFGGGDEITENLLLNTCRESSDHGPWNSWDRVPYITDIRTGKPSIIPADRHIHHNFVMGTYNSQETIDTDDGSAYFKTYSNFFAYGDNGLKSDFGGHDHEWRDNVIAYVGNCFNVFSFKGYNDVFKNNTCVMRSGYKSDCDLDKSLEVHSNRIYSSSGDVKVCGMAWNDWVKSGKTRDTDTTVSKWPSDAQLVAWAKKLLDFGDNVLESMFV